MQVKVIDAVLSKEFNRFASSLQKMERMGLNSGGRLVWKYAARFAARLVFATQPFGNARRAKERGDGAVKRDIRRSYVDVSGLYVFAQRQSQDVADAIWKLWSDGQIQELEALLRSLGGKVGDFRVANFDSGRAHKSFRGPRGKVSRGARASLVVLRQDKNAIDEYIKQVQGRVGWSKSAWLSGFNPPGGLRGIPHWVKKQRGAPGKVIDKTRQGVTRSLVFNNQVPWTTAIFSERQAISAFRFVARLVEKDLEKAVVEAAKKTGVGK